MTQRIIFPNSEGGVTVVIPSPNSSLTVEEIAAKAVPIGKPFKIVATSEIPTDRTFRDAWEYTT